MAKLPEHEVEVLIPVVVNSCGGWAAISINRDRDADGTTYFSTESHFKECVGEFEKVGPWRRYLVKVTLPIPAHEPPEIRDAIYTTHDADFCAECGSGLLREPYEESE